MQCCGGLPSLARLNLGADTDVWFRGQFDAGEVRSNDETWDRLSGEECLLCTEPLTEPQRTRDAPWALDCGHVYHESCLLRHFTTNGPGATCPECRKPIETRPDDAPALPAAGGDEDDDEDDDDARSCRQQSKKWPGMFTHPSGWGFPQARQTDA